MPRASRTFRIFVSSTFSDMKAERNALQEKVFPRLRELCTQHGCQFQAIDLRWGVSEEASIDQRTMRICLDELARCQRTSPRPNFIILLGDRYGWRPLAEEISEEEFKEFEIRIAESDKKALLQTWYKRDDNAVPPVYFLQPRTGIFRDHERWEREVEIPLRCALLDAVSGMHLPEAKMLKYTASATEQEIHAGAMRVPNAQGHVFGFFRTIRGLPTDKSAGEYIDLDDRGNLDLHAQGMLHCLKAKLIQLISSNSAKYGSDWTGDGITHDHLDKLCADVYDSLSRVILEEIARLETIDDLEKEIDAHEAFGLERARHFIGRVGILKAIADYTNRTDRFSLAVYGESGSGKSALMAQAIKDVRTTCPEAEIVFRFIGATPESSNGRSLLESLCRQVSRIYGADESDISSDYQELVREFRMRLSLAEAKRPLVLFLDALDQLFEGDNARGLDWLPAELPKHVRLIVSTLPGDCLDVLQGRAHKNCLVKLELMPPEEGEALLRLWFKEAARTLQPRQFQEVTSKFRQCGLPLYLKLAFEETRHWSSYSDPKDTVISPEIEGVIHDLFARLSAKENHGEVMVSRCLGYLAAAKNGLSEEEMLGVLSADEEVMKDFIRRSPKSQEVDHLPVVVWSRLYFDLEPYLAERSVDGTFVIAFFHRNIKNVAAHIYLSGMSEFTLHDNLAEYFNKLEIWLESVDVQRHRALSFPPVSRKANLRRISELPWHRLQTANLNEMFSILTSISFLEAKVESDRIWELIGDFRSSIQLMPKKSMNRRLLMLLLETLQSHVHFLANHPTTLFQCLWNSCWWFDCHEFRRHYQKLGDIDYEVGLPDHDELLSYIVQKWRFYKEQVTPGFVWIRSRRPPSVRLLSGQQAVLLKHTKGVLSICWPDRSSLLASSSWDGTLRIWNMTLLKEIKIYENPNYYIFSLSRDGAMLARQVGPKIMLCDAVSGSEIGFVEVVDSSADLMAFTSDGSRLIAGWKNDALYWWDTSSMSEIRRLPLPKDSTNLIVLSPDLKYVAITSRENMISVIEIVKMQLINQWKAEFEVECLSFSSQGALIAAGGYLESQANGVYKVWNITTGATELERNLKNCFTSALCFSHNDGMLAIGGSDNYIYIWHFDEKKILFKFKGHDERVLSFAFSSDDRKLASGSVDRTIRLWSLDEHLEDAGELHNHDYPVYGNASFSPEGRCCVSFDFGEGARCWDVQTGLCIHQNVVRSSHTHFGPPMENSIIVDAGENETIVKLCDSEKTIGWIPHELLFAGIHQQRGLISGHQEESHHLYLYSIEGRYRSQEGNLDPGEGVTSFSRLQKMIQYHGSVASDAADIQLTQAASFMKGVRQLFISSIEEEVGIWEQAEEYQAANYLLYSIEHLLDDDVDRTRIFIIQARNWFARHEMEMARKYYMTALDICRSNGWSDEMNAIKTVLDKIRQS